jgi:hypothetical protein
VRDFSCETFWLRRVVWVISFWDSSSSSTDAEYWPFEFGVAGRKPLPEGVVEPFEWVYGFVFACGFR